MPEAKTVSIHKTTTGGVSEFLDDEAFECLGTMKLLSFLSGALLRYEEEGIELNPQVVLCGSVETLARSFPGGKFYLIGSSPFSSELGKVILKECAALAQFGWVVFVERVSPTDVNYGVLSYLASPTSLSLRDMIEVDDTAFAVLIERVDNSTVRLSGSKGNSLDVAFSTTRDSAKDDGDICKFAETCTPPNASDATRRYMSGLVGKLLSQSHGTILVCCDKPILTVPGMTDAVVLSPAIDILAAFEDYRTTNTSDALLELQRTESLLSGLLQSDGIVSLNGSGQVTAYRVFYKPPSKDATTLPISEGSVGAMLKGFKSLIRVPAARKAPRAPPTPAPRVTGGARRRAFEGVATLVGSHLKSALFRSQDGHTVFSG